MQKRHKHLGERPALEERRAATKHDRGEVYAQLIDEGLSERLALANDVAPLMITTSLWVAADEGDGHAAGCIVGCCLDGMS